MKTRLKQFGLIFVASAMLQTACKKEDSNTVSTTVVTSGIYVLNQGVWNSSNSTISAYDGTASGTVDVDYYQTQNTKGLGDTGNDLKIYNDKMYCVVNGSEYVSIMDASTAKEQGRVSFQGKQPRNIAFNGTKGYVCSTDNTVCEIDLNTLAITATITVGKNPEDLCVANGKLYVSNSGYGSDNTVSVIDFASLKVEQTITVGDNPGHIEADSNGNVFVLLQGKYDDSYNFIPNSRLIKKIDANGNVSDLATAIDFMNFAISNNKIYAYATTNKLQVYNSTNGTLLQDNFIVDGTTIKNTYGVGIAINSIDSKVYICDANDNISTGWLYCFGTDGKLLYKKDVGITPSRVAFLIK